MAAPADDPRRLTPRTDKVLADPAVAAACRDALDAAGWRVTELELSHVELAPAAGLVRTLGELGSGIPAQVLADADPLVRALMLASRLWPMSLLIRADRVRAALRRALAEAFAGVDLIAWPTLPAPPCALNAPVLELPSGTTLADAGNVRQATVANLAGVPSVVYGILGGFVFVDMIFKPLSLYHEGIAPRNLLGGGLTLGLLTLPVIIVAAQEAIRAVPNSIRMGAYALGATKWQTIWQQVIPLAWPGILTGTILALSRAIGEAAPLVLFGALLFVNQTPSLFSRFAVLPMQIFGWSDRPEEVWLYDAAMGCIVLMILLLSLNGVAIWLRNRAQRKLKW